MLRFHLAIATIALLLSASASGGEFTEEQFRFFRPTAKGFVPEATFTIKRDQAAWSIVAVTERGVNRLTVTARYDDKDHLLGADATLSKGDQKTTATVTVADGKAKVERPGQPALEFGVPAGVIVTSAPDWCDIFLLCRRYDRKKGCKQSFTGLWIHPTDAPLLLPFSIEREGTDPVKHDNKDMELDRYLIRIRGPNPYVAWADSRGLVKLLPLPYKEGALTGLVRADYGKSLDQLRRWQP